MNLRAVATLMVSVMMMACSAVSETSFTTDGAVVTPTATPVYNCSYYNEFDSLSDCQTTTSANCDWSWRSFPGGGVGICYTPLAGWEACAATPATWIYTASNSCRSQISVSNPAGTQYQFVRSVVSCSSTICACLAAQETAGTCEDGVSGGTCNGKVSIPTPSPTPNCP